MKRIKKLGIGTLLGMIAILFGWTFVASLLAVVVILAIVVKTIWLKTL